MLTTELRTTTRERLRARLAPEWPESAENLVSLVGKIEEDIFNKSNGKANAVDDYGKRIEKKLALIPAPAPAVVQLPASPPRSEFDVQALTLYEAWADKAATFRARFPKGASFADARVGKSMAAIHWGLDQLDEVASGARSLGGLGELQQLEKIMLNGLDKVMSKYEEKAKASQSSRSAQEAASLATPPAAASAVAPRMAPTAALATAPAAAAIGTFPCGHGPKRPAPAPAADAAAVREALVDGARLVRARTMGARGGGASSGGGSSSGGAAALPEALPAALRSTLAALAATDAANTAAAGREAAVFAATARLLCARLGVDPDTGDSDDGDSAHGDRGGKDGGDGGGGEVHTAAVAYLEALAEAVPAARSLRLCAFTPGSSSHCDGSRSSSSSSAGCAWRVQARVRGAVVLADLVAAESELGAAATTVKLEGLWPRAVVVLAAAEAAQLRPDLAPVAARGDGGGGGGGGGGGAQRLPWPCAPSADPRCRCIGGAVEAVAAHWRGPPPASPPSAARAARARPGCGLEALAGLLRLIDRLCILLGPAGPVTAAIVTAPAQAQAANVARALCEEIFNS